jgi:small-conductance mechanosensitive channel
VTAVEALRHQLALHPALVSLVILLLSYVGARVVSFVMERFLTRAATRTATSIDDRLVVALKRPVTYVLFVSGARIAAEWLPLSPRWAPRIYQGLFILTVSLVALAAMRAYAILLHWYVSDSGRVGEDGPAREFRPLFSKLGKVVIALMALVTALQSLGVNVESLVLSMGVGSLAVGLAARDTLANMFAGFTIMLDRPFHLGDRIQLSSGEVGDVEAIGMRATRLRTPDDTVLVVPNSLIVQDRLVNRAVPTRHITTRIDVGVAYGTDLTTARAILVESALASPYVEAGRQPSPGDPVRDFAVRLRLVFWAKDYDEQALALSSVHEEIYRRFAGEGIEIPFPVQRVVKSAGAEAPAAEA